MRKIVLTGLLFLSLPSLADEGVAPVSLAELAQKADLVALAQVKDTDYFYRRQYPVSGSAYLKVLISYKMDQADDLIEVSEKGLHENECYFPNPGVFEEGRRYLVFLRRDAEKPGLYRGLTEGCALDILVDANNGYALRLPASGIRLSDPLEELAQKMRFSDPYALENEESLGSTRRNIMLDSGLMTPRESPADHQAPGVFGATTKTSETRQWIYTTGIDLTIIRRLMQLDASPAQETNR